MGTPRATSSAWEGPEIMTTLFCGSSSAMTTDSDLSDSCSKPLATQETTASGERIPFTEAQTPRTAKEGVATMTRSASECAGSCQVIATDSGMITPGSSFLCSRAAERVSISCWNGE